MLGMEDEVPGINSPVGQETLAARGFQQQLYSSMPLVSIIERFLDGLI